MLGLQFRRILEFLARILRFLLEVNLFLEDSLQFFQDIFLGGDLVLVRGQNSFNFLQSLNCLVLMLNGSDRVLQPNGARGAPQRHVRFSLSQCFSRSLEPAGEGFIACLLHGSLEQTGELTQVEESFVLGPDNSRLVGCCDIWINEEHLAPLRGFAAEEGFSFDEGPDLLEKNVGDQGSLTSLQEFVQIRYDSFDFEVRFLEVREGLVDLQTGVLQVLSYLGHPFGVHFDQGGVHVADDLAFSFFCQPV